MSPMLWSGFMAALMMVVALGSDLAINAAGDAGRRVSEALPQPGVSPAELVPTPSGSEAESSSTDRVRPGSDAMALAERPRADYAFVAALRPSADLGRVLVSSASLTQRPYRGLILVSVGERVVCTGFVVAPTKVVTAGHCLVQDASEGKFKLRRGLPDNIRVHRAYSEVAGGSPYQSCRVSRAWVHPRFARRNAQDREYASRAHDYAVLTTTPGCSYPRSAVMRLWATVPLDGQLRVEQPTRLAGYPADPRFDDMNGRNLWRTQGELRANGTDTRILNTTGFVAQGMSGGPVWRTFGAGSPCGRGQCVIAILTECEVNGRGLCKTGESPRRTVRITPSVKRAILRH